MKVDEIVEEIITAFFPEKLKVLKYSGNERNSSLKLCYEADVIPSCKCTLPFVTFLTLMQSTASFLP